MLFLAALWRRVTEPAVERRLRHLLRKRHHNANIDLVIDELRRQNLIPGSDIRSIIDFLRREFADGQQNEGRWMTAARWLYQLDPTELDKVIHDPGLTIKPHRKLDAIVELMKHDPARLKKNLTDLAHSLTITETTTPQDCLNTAVHIGYRDRELGVQTVRRLVHTPEMGKLRVNMAIHLNWPELFQELIERGRTLLSDDGRLELSAAWLKQDQTTAVASMEPFAQTTRKDDTPLEIAKMIQHHDECVALRIAKKVAWPANPKIDNSAVRLNAVILIGKIEPAEAIPELKRLSKEHRFVTGAVRVEAAIRIVTEHGGPIIAVVDLGNDPELDRTYRVKAAKFVGAHERATGARLYISIAKTCTLQDKSQLDLLREAYKLDPAPAAHALAKVAENRRIPGQIRFDAVEIARPKLSTERTISLYTIIARTTDNHTAALAAARKVGEMNQKNASQRLMGELAERRNADTTFRLTAAREAGTYGTSALIDLGRPAYPDTVCLEAAQALCAIGRKEEAKPILQRLGREA